MQRPHQLDFLNSLTAEASAWIVANQPTDDELFLPGLPTHYIRQIYANAPGNEIGSGKFNHPELSAALVANTFGYFLECPREMPALPGCEQFWLAASSISLEATLSFPWNAGRHPCLDVVIVNDQAVFAIEAKRFEPYREKAPSSFSRAYWRRVWGTNMDGYKFIRDALNGCSSLFTRLDAAQLVKHALGLRTAVDRDPVLRSKIPILVYLYAEPAFWPEGRPIRSGDVQQHRKEIRRFANCVAEDEIQFKAISYQALLNAWWECGNGRIQNHVRAVKDRFVV